MSPSFISQLSNAKTSQAELHLLEEMRQELLPLTTPTAEDTEEDIFEKDFLTFAKSSFEDDNPFPRKALEVIFPNNEDLNRFTCYLFERRYGWSEIGKDGQRRVRRLSCGSVLPSGTVHHKAIVNDLLDDFLKWYLHQPLSVRLLNAYQYVLTQVQHTPVVRNQAFIQIMQWFKKQTSEIACQNEMFDLVEGIIIAGLTDVWSAIRSSCATRITSLSTELPPHQLHHLFTQLAQLCVDVDSCWQCIEGAVMGLNAVIKGLKWTDKNEDSNDASQDIISNGKSTDPMTSKYMLQCVSEQIKEVIFPLLAHPQLTIRENSTKTLASYLSRTHFKESLSCFEHVCQRLRAGTEQFLDSKTHQSNNLHQMTLDSKYCFLDAYAAEGLLGVCVLLVKRIPLCYLLPQWPYYMSTFLLYLMHPASTVRQTTSSVFKYLVSKSSINPVLVKLLLSELIADWTPDPLCLSQSEEQRESLNYSHKIHPSITDKNDTVPVARTWEFCEGRLFAYELMLKFTVKNHWLYTFGPAIPSSTNEKAANNSLDKDTTKEKLTRRISEVTLTPSNNDLQENECPQSCQESVSSHSQPKTKVMTLDSLMTNGKARPYSPRTRTHDLGPKGHSGMMSLLSQLQRLEQSLSQTDDLKAMDRQVHLLLEALQHKDAVSEPVFDWLSQVKLQPMGSILTKLFHQITECVIDSQWELRRMGLQALPCLTEVMRWYDMALVTSLLSSHLTPQPSPLTFSCVLTLRDSLLHSSSLQLLLRNPPSAWQDQDRCKDAIVKICSHMQENIESYLPIVQQLATRGSYDKLSVISVCVLMLAVSHFNLSKSQKTQCIIVVLNYWKSLFCMAHAKTNFTAELSVGSKQTVFKSPYTGYLSCCLVKPENLLCCAKQVEKTLLGESQGCLVSFVRSLSGEESSPLLPVFTHLIGVFPGDSQLCKVLLESLSFVASSSVTSAAVEESPFRGDAIRFIYLALKEINWQITNQELDMQTVRRLLEIYLTLSKAIVLSKHLPTLLRAISARINQTSSFMVHVSPRPSDDLAILSNDIPPSTNSDVDSEGSDSEEIAGPSAVFQECFTLNVSNNSGSFASGRLSALSTHSSIASEGRVMTPASSIQSETDQHSDWDSWSDEEEDVSALQTVFTDFLSKLQHQFKDKGPSLFHSELQKLDDPDRQLILSLLNNHI